MDDALPSKRSKASAPLDAFAAEGRFALQVCRQCSTVHYPAHDVCRNCLSTDLEWNDVDPTGALVAMTTVRISAEPHYQAKAPFSVGLVELKCGPKVVCFLDDLIVPGAPVKLSLQLDAVGRAIMFASSSADAGNSLGQACRSSHGRQTTE